MSIRGKRQGTMAADARLPSAIKAWMAGTGVVGHWLRPDALAAGASLGVAAGSIWILIVSASPLLTHPPVWFEFVGPPVLLTLVIGSWFGGGASFGRLVQGALGGRGFSGPLLTGVATTAVTLLTLALALQIEQIAVEERRFTVDLFPLVFAAAFAPHILGLVLVGTLVSGRVGRGTGVVRSALIASGLAFVTFLLMSLVLSQLPGWHIGSGERAMVKVAMVANTLAGVIGGTTAAALLCRGGPLGPSRRDA